MADDGGSPERVDDLPFDEAHDVDDAEDLESNLAVTPTASRERDFEDESDYYGMHGGKSLPLGSSPPELHDDDVSDGYYDDDNAEDRRADSGTYDTGHADQKGNPGKEGGSDDGGFDDMDPDDVYFKGQYDPKDYEHLEVSSDIKDLFEFITDFKPRISDIGTQLDPFIPDFIPAVGDIDAMIKITAPARIDGVDHQLGLEVIDEPCAAQSDPAVLDLQLRAISKTTTKKAVQVKQIPDVSKGAKLLDNWITSITDLHREKPPQSIQYSTAMPDVELLMQEWPEGVEDVLNSITLPGADLDIPIATYASIVCAILDIPVHRSRIEALHVLFSLFVEFKSSQGFRSKEDEDAAAAVAGVGEPDVMRL
eukprot:m.174815 g.174815  ORF g.174815 m.174815 type:complete len:366 (+) comp18335_c0_seq2:292-1389(+)